METPAPSHSPAPESRADFISIRNFNFFYGQKQALFDITLDIPDLAPTWCYELKIGDRVLHGTIHELAR